MKVRLALVCAARCASTEEATSVPRCSASPDPQAPLADSDILVDVDKLTYRFRRYPSLCGLHRGSWAGLRSWGLWLLSLVVGAFFIAGWAQVSFYFPCTAGYTSVSFKSVDYCVNNGDIGQVVRRVAAWSERGACRLQYGVTFASPPAPPPADQHLMPRERVLQAHPSHDAGRAVVRSASIYPAHPPPSPPRRRCRRRRHMPSFSTGPSSGGGAR
jgi:hypothetical protein